MEYEIECYRCDHEFKVKEWKDGNCPNCNKAYSWDEICTEDDFWAILIFED